MNPIVFQEKFSVGVKYIIATNTLLLFLGLERATAQHPKISARLYDLLHTAEECIEKI